MSVSTAAGRDDERASSHTNSLIHCVSRAATKDEIRDGSGPSEPAIAGEDEEDNSIEYLNGALFWLTVAT
jgi:hypothetical protein